jgi:hypothetical protein
MADKETKVEKKVYVNKGGGNAVYCLGVIGSIIYYVGSVDGFWNIILAILKGFVWPAFVVYDLLKFLH